MADSRTAWHNRAYEALERAGCRSGGARSAVVDLLAGERCCLSAREIAVRLAEQGTDVGLASVYRALDLLHGMGLMQRVDTGDGGALYEPVIPGGHHHHHVVCDGCGQISPFEDERLERAIEHLERRLEHEVSGHDVVIRGRCAGCASS